MKVSAFVLPYHLHSFQMAQIEVYFTDLCSSDSKKCYMDKYAELCWEHLDNSSLTDESEIEFVK